MAEILLRWNSFADGMGDSPHVGNGIMRAVEIDTFSGGARVGKKPTSAFHTSTSSTFTADAGTDVCTGASFTTSANSSGIAVTVSTTGTLPAGLSASTNYFVIRVDQNLGTFKLATTIANANAGTAIDITSAGTGTHTVTTVEPGTILHYARDPRTGTLFGQDSNGRVWYNLQNSLSARLLNGNTIGVANSEGNGLIVFRVSDGSATYLFAFRNAAIDVVNVLGTTQLEAPSWTNSWQSLNSGAASGNSHHARIGQDNIIYFCDDRYVGSIKENSGSVFAPATGTTYTYNNQALDLPLGSLTYWLEELGTDLLISVSNDSFIYPWDRISDSFGLPFPIGEREGNKMKNIGNVVYILAGRHGNIYQTQGTFIRPHKTIPIYASYNSATPSSVPITWGGIESVLGKLAVGVGALSGESGVYLIDQNGRMTIDNIPSTGEANVTALFATNEFYQMGYAGGSDVMDTSRYSTLGTVVLESPFYRLGTSKGKSTISELEYQIANGVSGSIRISYREDLTSSFTTLTTWTTTTTATSDTYDAGLIDLENIQFQVELSGNIDFLELRAYK